MSLKKTIFGEFWEKLTKPWVTSFTSYFICYVVFIGGLGVIASLLNYLSSKETNSSWSITENLITYSLALAIPSIVPILLTNHNSNYKSSLAVLAPFICIIVPIALTFFSYYCAISWPAYVCVIIALIIWVISQSDNEILNDETYAEKREKNAKHRHGNNWNK